MPSIWSLGHHRPVISGVPYYPLNDGPSTRGHRNSEGAGDVRLPPLQSEVYLMDKEVQLGS